MKTGCAWRVRHWNSAKTCESIEGRYRPPSDDAAALSEEDRAEAVEREKRRRPSWTPDVHDGWKLKDAWRFMRDPYRLMLALVHHRRRFA